MQTLPYKTRFCPSPTGQMHLGNGRTALFNALLAWRNAGTLLLRIEDTDIKRSKQRYADQLFDELRWLGVVWQEGPQQDGDHGPYWQSQRQPVYAKFYQQLEAAGHVYPCFCSDEQLARARKRLLAAGRPPRYLGTCCNLSAEEISQQLAAGLKPTLRFRLVDKQKVVFDDLVKGAQCFNSSDIGDFIIRRATHGLPPSLNHQSHY